MLRSRTGREGGGCASSQNVRQGTSGKNLVVKRRHDRVAARPALSAGRSTRRFPRRSVTRWSPRTSNRGPFALPGICPSPPGGIPPAQCPVPRRPPFPVRCSPPRPRPASDRRWSLARRRSRNRNWATRTVGRPGRCGRLPQRRRGPGATPRLPPKRCPCPRSPPRQTLRRTPSCRATRCWASWAGAAWASSTRPGTCASTAWSRSR